jgi:hypothetical protein
MNITPEDPLKKYWFHPLTRRIVRNPWVQSIGWLALVLIIGYGLMNLLDLLRS